MILKPTASLLFIALLLPMQPMEGAENREVEETEFTRLTRDGGGTPLALETSIVRYAPADHKAGGPVVDLVSAVHVGESSYYEGLNRRFQEYDAVLYELVAPEGTVVPKGGVKRGSSGVSMLQMTMTDVLNLEFQLNAIDYRAANFIHADMTPKQFSESMKERNETVFKTFFRMLGHAMAQQGGTSSGGEIRLLFALFSKDRAMALKRVLAEEFENVESSLAAINGPDGSTLITERNKVALGVLREQMAAGHKKFAIFYGAGHMYDFEERLRDDFSLVPSGTTWVTAWDLTGPKEPGKRPKKDASNRSKIRQGRSIDDQPE